MPAARPSSSSQERGYENSTQIALRESSSSLPKLSSFFRFRRSSSPTNSTTIPSTKQTEAEAKAKASAALRPHPSISTTNSTTTTMTTTTNDNANASRSSSVSTLGPLPQTKTDETAADEEFVYKQIMRHHTPITLTAKEAKKLAKLQVKAMKSQRESLEKERKRT